jgi:hypothetical protein
VVLSIGPLMAQFSEEYQSMAIKKIMEVKDRNQNTIEKLIALGLP